MAEYSLGAEANQIIRLSVGSPATWFVFSDRTNAVAIDNIGGSGVFFNFDALATSGSVSGYIPAGQMRALDIRCGSVSILASGTSTGEVQCLRIT
jgi:hypothetical protein